MPPKKKAADVLAAKKKTKKKEEVVVAEGVGADDGDDDDEKQEESVVVVDLPAKKAKTTAGATQEKQKKAAKEEDDDEDDGDDGGDGDVADADDPLNLKPLFKGSHGPWYSLLKETITKAPNADTFIAPSRAASIVPVRELTFQALKPNPPENWQVVVFGQNPYPRLESATGIAMLDNTFKEWKDKRFGVVTSMRCIMKTACIWKYGIAKATPVSEIRTMLKKNNIVDPHGWFKAMLTQGCLLMNAALTASADKSLATGKHTTFWRPIVIKMIEEILRAKRDKAAGGVVFAWWGNHAKVLRKKVMALQEHYPEVAVEHVDYCNPAAMGDAFCNSNHFEDLNVAIKKVGGSPIDWLPKKGWDEGTEGVDAEHSSRMGQFVTDTLELHKLFLERLKDLQNEGQKELDPIRGVAEAPLLSMEDILARMQRSNGRSNSKCASFATAFKAASRFAEGKKVPGNLSKDEVAAIHLYTMGSSFYRTLNAALRDPDRTRAAAFLEYLRLFFSALDKLKGTTTQLWRGVSLDLRAQYKKGSIVTWWGVSSCTVKKSVAYGFLGGKGMLFSVRPRNAVSIRPFSAFQGEDEYIVSPGARLKVVDVKSASNICNIALEELDEEPLVA